PLLEMESEGKHAFLSQARLARANAQRNLALVHLFGCPDITDMENVQGQEIHRLAYEAFVFSHAGFGIREFWQEAVVPEAILHVASSGCRETSIRQTPSGAAAHLFKFTQEDSMTNPVAPLAYLLKYPTARFGFSPGQQRLLELALLGLPDRDA